MESSKDYRRALNRREDERRNARLAKGALKAADEEVRAVRERHARAVAKLATDRLGDTSVRAALAAEEFVGAFVSHLLQLQEEDDGGIIDCRMVRRAATSAMASGLEGAAEGIKEEARMARGS